MLAYNDLEWEQKPTNWTPKHVTVAASLWQPPFGSPLPSGSVASLREKVVWSITPGYPFPTSRIALSKSGPRHREAWLSERGLQEIIRSEDVNSQGK